MLSPLASFMSEQPSNKEHYHISIIPHALSTRLIWILCACVPKVMLYGCLPTESRGLQDGAFWINARHCCFDMRTWSTGLKL